MWTSKFKFQKSPQALSFVRDNGDHDQSVRDIMVLSRIWNKGVVALLYPKALVLNIKYFKGMYLISLILYNSVVQICSLYIFIFPSKT